MVHLPGAASSRALASSGRPQCMTSCMLQRAQQGLLGSAAPGGLQRAGGRRAGSASCSRRPQLAQQVVCAAQPDPFRDLANIIDKYSGTGSNGSTGNSQPPARRSRPPAARNGGMGNGVFSLLFINFALFAAQRFLHLPILAQLPLQHWRPQWWQFITCTFMHASWEHLSSNAFSLLVFGRMVEEEEGGFGVWLTYLLAGVGGAVASYLTSPSTRTISLGASGAVFGLFAVAIATKFKPSIKKLLEFTILGQFVMRQVLQEVQLASSGKALMVGSMSVGHVAHLAGAAVGVLLVLLLARLPDADSA